MMLVLGETKLPETTFTPDTRSMAERGAANRAAYGRLHRAADELQRWRDNATSRADARFEAYERRIEAVEKLTGQRLKNPMRLGRVDDAGGLGDTGNDPALIEDVFGRETNDPEKQFSNQLAALAKKHPEHAGMLTQDIGEQAIALVKTAEAEHAAAADAFAQTGMPEFWPQLSGGLRGALRDPVQLATLPLGLGSTAKTIFGRIAQTIFTEAAINAGVEGGVQAAAEQWRRETGSAIGADGIWSQIGLAAAFGGGLGGLAQGGAEIFKAAGKALPRPALDRLARGEADAGDMAALAEAAGIDLSPADRSALESAVEADADAAAAYAGIDPRAAGEAVAAIEADRPLPHMAGPDMAGFTAETLPQGNFRFIKANDLEVDAARFQFKDGGDASGVTSRLAGVKEWKPERAGVTIAWEDEAGRLFVADGHQRTGLARRIGAATGQEISLPSYVFRAKDGVSAGDARVIAALKNIAEGSGTAIDAAKVLRTSKLGVEATGLPPGSALVRDAAGLARLSDDAFAMAVNGVVDPKLAAIAGRLADDPRLHAQILATLKDAKAHTLGEAESMVRDMLDEPSFTETQIGLFGAEDVSRLLLKEKAMVRQAALSSLKNDKSVFKKLIEEQTRIAEAGNVLDNAANTERMQGDGLLIEAIDKLSRQRGPVADALNAAARAIAGGEGARGASRRFVETVRDEVGRAGGNLGAIGEAGPARLIDPARAAEPGTDRKSVV